MRKHEVDTGPRDGVTTAEQERIKALAREVKELRRANERLKLASLEWVAWFHHHRLLEPIGYIPPAEAEANYLSATRRTVR